MGTMDVGTVLALYERDQDQQVQQQPMHGRPGEVRRNPSTDQKKVRRAMTKSAADEAQTESIPSLLARAAAARDPEEQRALMLEVEQRTTAKTASYEAGRSLDLTVKEAVEVIPRGTHELHTEATDWLMGEGMHVTASAQTAQHALIAEASLWFQRVPDYVKEDLGEYRTQALNLARRTASQYGDQAEAACQAFVNETERLHKQATKIGQIKTAALMDVPDLDTGGTTQRDIPTQHRPDPHHGPLVDTSLPNTHIDTSTPGLHQELNDHLTGQDAAGVGDAARGYAQHAIQHGGSLQTTASLQTQAALEDAQLAAVLAGAMDSDPGEGEEGSQGNPDTQGVGFDSPGGQKMGANGYPDVDTSSTRAPALEEIANYQGFNGSSVVPPGNNAAAMNGDTQPERDFAQGGQPGMLVSGGLYDPTTHAARVAAQLTKESSMHEKTCPTCSGHGRVAVRVQAYSGLPQIDQIVNADETPGNQPAPGQTESYPSAVAFPLTGWGEPGQGQANVQNTINEAEQQIANRPQGRPGAPGPGGPGGSVTSGYIQHQANGRDNSGWMGDMGAKGTDYPGYSTPAYDGSSSTGYVDPVYGQGGDQGNRPLRPYGEMEANDETNVPSQPYDPGAPHNADQGQSTVSPTMSTMGSFHPDAYIASAQRQIVEAQQAIADRNAQLAGQRR